MPRKRRRADHHLATQSAGSSSQSLPSPLSSSATPPSQSSDKFVCRVPLRALAALVRQRKNELSLRIQSEYSHLQPRSSTDKRDDTGESGNGSGGTLCLTFEFQWQAASSNRNDTDAAPLLRALHRIPVAAVSHVSAAVARREGASEVQAHPAVLLRLLEPLKRTAEAALIVRADHGRLHASSFHHYENQHTDKNNAILQSNSQAWLKTETGIGCDELHDFFFRQDRKEDDDEEEENDENDNMPPNVNQHVILVFPIKEAKAFLQFASHSQPAAAAQPPLVDLLFHWGGKPLVWHVEQQQQQVIATSERGASWKAELILATLDHSLLGTNLEDG